jgi:hypothetical protein
VLGGLLVGSHSPWAGGDFVDLAVGSGRVWLVSGDGVRSFDAGTGRQLSMPRRSILVRSVARSSRGSADSRAGARGRRSG